jgi:Mor family transcriptional regulator
MSNDWIKEITVDDLPAAYNEMSQIIGIENTIKLALHYGGLPYYFQKVDSLLQKIRDEKIKKEFRGNYTEIARKYNLSEMHVRRIINSNGKDDRQEGLFGEPS